MNGVIKKKTPKGFGFISQDGQAKDLFFHGNSLVGITFDELQEGDNVSFDVVKNIYNSGAASWYSQCETEARIYENKNLHNAVKYYDKHCKE